ncbi:MAG: GNAT family N-acetyltransferase [Ardenticatenaceae bacterium]|nr:GNAT family N-acetyltransferase [Anaerolineales bacterium]MCB8922215.1 GNAT family N-acetyltransferase [Ardenticatenaceae bacterium]
MTTLTQRIQNYLHTKYRQHTIIDVPPFQLYLRRTEAHDVITAALPYQNQSNWQVALEQIIATCQQQERTARVQFLDTFAPTLPLALKNLGFRQIEKRTVLACTPATYRPAPSMPGLSTIILSQQFSADDVHSELPTRELGFNPEMARAGGTDALTFQHSLMTDRAFVLRLNREAVAAGMFGEIHENVTELVGVTTLPAFRRRGFAAYLTGYMTQVAFARQVDVAFMLVDTETAANVFKRVGYSFCATLLSYQLEN